METLPLVHLDTHVIVWLWANEAKRLAPLAKRLESSDLVISSMVYLELDYLHEAERINASGAEIFAFLADAIELRLASSPFAPVVRMASGMTWTRDPFDRIIAAHAYVDGATLVTHDRIILKHCTWAARA